MGGVTPERLSACAQARLPIFRRILVRTQYRPPSQNGSWPAETRSRGRFHSGHVAERLASPCPALARAYINHPSSEKESVGGHIEGLILMGGLHTWPAVEVLHGVHNGDRIAARHQRQGD